MDRLVRCETVRPKWREFLKMVKANGGTKDAARKLWEMDTRSENYRNDTYHVMVDKEDAHGFGDVAMWYLSIKRHDREPIMDWRDLQECKNQICGPETEGIMLYPAESRVVDTANQYHMYVFMDEKYRIPCGFWTRSITDDPNFGKAKQRSRKGA